MGMRNMTGIPIGLLAIILSGCGGGDSDPAQDDDATQDDDDDVCAKYAVTEGDVYDQDWCDDDDLSYDDDDSEPADDDDDDDASGSGTGGDPLDPEVCDEITVDPATIYMSADDSNSQAAPVLARLLIEAGAQQIWPMRTYEFLNYGSSGKWGGSPWLA